MWQRTMLSLCAAALLAAQPARAGFEEDLASLQLRWASARYQTKVDQRKPILHGLIKEADVLTERNAGNAEAWLWSAIIRGSLAEAENNLSALGLVKEAKAGLEKSIAIDPKAENGYAYGVLGQMYAQVPGRPFGFGDKKKAKEYLEKGLAVSPEGIDANYFYAQFLYDEGEYSQAKQYIERARKAAPGSRVPVADQGRQTEIKELLDKIDKKLH